MITSFADRRTAAIFAGYHVKGVPADVAKRARTKLIMLNHARELGDLRVPPGNRLEPLVGDRAGQHSIRVNDQWRLCFVWNAGSAELSSFVITTNQEQPMVIDRKELESGRVDLSDVVDAEAPPITPTHPGEILREEFIEPLEITPYRLAKDLGVPLTRITEILAGKRAITAETALRLGRYFGTTAEFWLGVQDQYELDMARLKLGRNVMAEVKPRTIGPPLTTK